MTDSYGALVYVFLVPIGSDHRLDRQRMSTERRLCLL